MPPRRNLTVDAGSASAKRNPQFETISPRFTDKPDIIAKIAVEREKVGKIFLVGEVLAEDRQFNVWITHMIGDASFELTKCFLRDGIVKRRL